jgi:hypothetical protein
MFKLLLANPYALAAAGLLLVASYGAVGYKAYQLGQDNVTAANAKLMDVETRTREAAIAAAAEAISTIEVRNVTIRQKAETIVRENVVYRDCQHAPDGLRLVNEALTGKSQPADPGELPGTGTAD